MSNVFAITARAFRFYEDGGETDSTEIDAESTNITRNVASDSNLQLRYGVQETGAGSGAGATTDDYQLQYELNDSGTWVSVTGSSSVVKAFPSASLTDAGATTSRLSAGSGSFVAGEIDEADGVITDWRLTANNYSDLLFSITIVAADVSASDTIDFRVLRNGSIFDAYSVTPRITVDTTPPAEERTASGATVSIAQASSGSATSVASGSGASSASVQVSAGTGAAVSSGSGATSSASQSAAGDGTAISSGSGATTAAAQVVAGTAEIASSERSGSGETSAATQTTSGSGSAIATGSGATASGTQTAAGSAVTISSATGTTVQAAQVVSGSGAAVVSGAGAATASAQVVTGSLGEVGAVDPVEESIAGACQPLGFIGLRRDLRIEDARAWILDVMSDSESAVAEALQSEIETGYLSEHRDVRAEDLRDWLLAFIDEH